MNVLCDEMYPPGLAAALRKRGIDASTVVELGLAGRSDPEVLVAATDERSALLTENVADFVRIAAERLTAGGHHHGLLIALSARFSRRPGGIPTIVAAVAAVGGEDLHDRVVYLEPPPR